MKKSHDPHFVAFEKLKNCDESHRVEIDTLYINRLYIDKDDIYLKRCMRLIER